MILAVFKKIPTWISEAPASTQTIIYNAKAFTTYIISCGPECFKFPSKMVDQKLLKNLSLLATLFRPHFYIIVMTCS